MGRKVVQLRGDLGRLQSSITRHNNDLQGMRQQTIANAGAFHARVGGSKRACSRHHARQPDADQ